MSDTGRIEFSDGGPLAVKWVDIQMTTTAIVQERPELLSAWLYMLSTSEKMRDVITQRRAPTKEELSELIELPSLFEISDIAAELVAEYHETARAARALAEAANGEE